MADRYQDRPLSVDGFGRGGDQHQRAEADPLAELARLIGQNDPFAVPGRGNPAPPSRAVPANQFQPPVDEDKPAAGPPPWMRRANPQEIPREAQREMQAPRETARDLPAGFPQQADYRQVGHQQADYEPTDDHQELPYADAPHPLQQRYVAAPPAVEPDFHPEPTFEAEVERDPARYDDALYGQIESSPPGDFPHDGVFSEDPYAYQDGYEDEQDEPEPKRRGGLLTVFAVLALAVIGTGGAFAYRTLIGSSRSGEPPIIRADNAPTKIMPAPQDGSAKVPDRLTMSDGTEKLVPREETPVDVNSRAIGGAPRGPFPTPDPNGSLPTSGGPNVMPSAGAPGNGTLSNGEPRKVRTLSVRGDQPGDGTAAVNSAAPSTAAKPPAAKMAARIPPSAANASANAPLSLSPQSAQDSVAVPPAGEQRAAEPPRPARVAAVNPAATAPAAGVVNSAAGGGYMVQVSSQKSEGDAQASYKALQGKFGSVLGSRDPVINRADLGEKGIVYQARVGPFSSRDEALQFCVNLKSAGGQCFVPKN